MKRFRLLVAVAAALVVLFLLAMVTAFNSSFQTWMVRRALADRLDVRAKIGRVSAGLQRVELTELHLAGEGWVLTLPALEADLPLFSAGMRDRVQVSRLVAKGWTLDLSRAQPGANAEPPRGAANPAVGVVPAGEREAAIQAFSGVFAQLALPVDLAVDGVELSGEVILPASRGRTKVTVRGGGLGAGREGKFDVAAEAALTDAAVSVVSVRSTVGAEMETPRTFRRLAVQLEAEARGTSFPNGVKLTTDIAAARAAGGETYVASVVGQARELLRVQAELPNNARQLDGSWKVDVSSAGIAPFALGKPLPDFTAVGEGRFDTDARFTALHATGRLDGTVNKLAALAPELAGIDELKFGGAFDLARRGTMLTVDKFTADIAAAQPVARVEALQAFVFNLQTAELKAADPARDLLAVALQGVPVAWAKPLLKEIELTGSELRGAFVATPRGGGVSLRSTTPLGISTLSLAQGEKSLVRDVSLTLSLSADYAPGGWQAEIGGLTAKTGDVTLLTLQAKAGQLAGQNQPLKAAGQITADLPGLFAQPATRGTLTLTRGSAVVDFVANIDARQEFQAKISLNHLAVDPKLGVENLPTIAADVRADLSPDGQLTLNAPVLLERGDRKSDFTLAGTLASEKNHRAIEARLTSEQLVIDDAKLLASAIAEPKTKEGPAAPRAAPPWAGLTGSVALQLKKVIYSDTFQATDVGGTLRLERGAMKLETVRAGLGETGEAKLTGTVIFDASLPQPYALAADLAVTEFDPGPLFRATAPDRPPTVEGRFNIASKLASRAATLGDLALGAGGEFQLTSRGGVFRGLPANVANLAETTSRVAGFINSLGAIAGRKEYDDITSKTQALAEFTRALGNVSFHQLSLVVARDAALNAVLKDFTLISPELRLTGTGQTRHRAGTGLLDDALSMEFKLRARGRQEALLKYLGVLEPQPDELGYVAVTLPLKIGGTLRRPDTGDLNQKLAAIALEKSGLGHLATELINRLRGNGK